MSKCSLSRSALGKKKLLRYTIFMLIKAKVYHLIVNNRHCYAYNIFHEDNCIIFSGANRI